MSIGVTSGSMEADLDIPYGDSFISHFYTVSKLQDMASFQVVLSIWYEQYSSQEISNKSALCSDKLYDMVKSLNTPTPIHNKLKNCVSKLEKRLKKWVKHFPKHSDHSKACEIPHLKGNWCVWRLNGEIDYKKTAFKMLSSPELSDVQKFGIMCEYCMEDEIKSFDLNLLPSQLVENVQWNTDPSIVYWISYLKNELGKLSGGRFGSVDVLVATKSRKNQKETFEYFWNRLSVDEQISIAKSRLNRPKYFSEIQYYCQDRLFSVMSWYQQSLLLAEMPDQIILNFWIRKKVPQLELAFWAWERCKNQMTTTQFANIVKEIFTERIGYDDEMQVFTNMWDTAPDHLREYATKHLVDVIVKPSLFGKMMPITNYVFSHEENGSWQNVAMRFLRKEVALKFLHKFLSLKSVDFRKQIMLKNAVGFGANVYDPYLMNDVINLCLPNPKDLSNYKKLIMDSPLVKKTFVDLLSRRNFKQLSLKLNFYACDANAAREIKKQLLGSKKIEKDAYFYKFELWHEMSNFIDETYSDNPSLALAKKKEFVLTLTDDCRSYWNDTEKIGEMIKVIENVYPAEELPAIKYRFFRIYQSELIKGDYIWVRFNGNFFDTFVTWCVGEGEPFQKFKNTFSIDRIFDVVLGVFQEYFLENSDFAENYLNSLDDTIEWFFNDAIKAKEYKRDRFEKFDLKKNKYFLTSLVEMDEVFSGTGYLKGFLEWFYDTRPLPAGFLKAYRKKLSR